MVSLRNMVVYHGFSKKNGGFVMVSERTPIKHGGFMMVDATEKWISLFENGGLKHPKGEFGQQRWL